MGIRPDILVTGGSGQLGSAFKRLLPKAFFPTREQLDLSRPESMRKALSQWSPGVVINAAAYTQVDMAEREPDLAFAINGESVGVLAKWAKDLGVTFVTMSTDYVFDGTSPKPYVEADLPNPLSVYGKSKLAGELKALEMCPESLIVRSSWVFGDGSNFIRTILGLARTKSALQIVDDQRGLLTYAPDLAKGILELLEQHAKGVVHLAGGGEPASWAALAREALSAAGSKSEVAGVSTEEYQSGKAGPFAKRPSNSVLDCSKAKALGVHLRPWGEAVKEYVKTLDESA